MTTRTSKPTRAVLYSRVSTRQQAESGLGIDAQQHAIRSYAAAFGWQIVADETENGVSGSVAPDRRPVLGPLLDLLDSGQADVLVAASLSRIGRDAADVLALAKRADSRGWSLAVLDIRLDTTTAVGRMILGVLAAVGQFERDMISQRTRDALAVLRAKGARLGRPSNVSDRTRRLVAGLHAQGASDSAISRALNTAGHPTASGGATWWPNQVTRVRRTLNLDAEAAAIRAGLAS